MKIRHIILSLPAVLLLGATASRPAYATACTEAKMKADRQHVGAIIARGDLRIGKYESVWVSQSFWRSMSYGQKSALADRVVCAVMGPQGYVYSVRFVVTWPRGLSSTGRIVGVWSEGKLEDRPLPRATSR